MAPTEISHYRLLDRFGEGGMGVVYRAEDLRLGREVAVKLLRTEATSEWLARFEREARLASSLQHPHICTIHELGDHEGQPFIVMELLEGRTIRQVLEAGPLDPDRVVAFGRQIADALDAAHRRGIIHRDLKPANLFLTHDDRVKVLDFGLAKIAVEDRQAGAGTTTTASMEVSTPTKQSASADLTKTGSTVGTAAYMSPEQAAGQPVDARTDLFSLGSVMYEMATGRRAFGGDDIPQITMKIVNGIVIPPRMVNDQVPPPLEAIIQKLLTVDLQRRYQHAAEVLADLGALADQLHPDSMPGADARSADVAAGIRANRRRVAAATAIVLVLAAAAGAWFLRRAPALTDRDSLLIGAFDNTTGEPVFDETLATALEVQLEQSPFLDIVPAQRIRETLASMNRPEDERLTPAIAREVCQRLGTKAMLQGSIGRLGTHYVVSLAATDCATGRSIARAQAEAESREQVLADLGAISQSMRTSLGESLPSLQSFGVPIEQATTPSLAALKAYALGLEERRRGGELEAVPFFNQAIELDPEFASAYTMLSTVYGSVGEWRRSEHFARLANDVPRKVSERERLLITYQYHDRVTGDQERAAQTLGLWKAAYPRDSRPVNALALIYNRMGRYNEAVNEAQEALRRSPGHPFPLSNLALAYRALGRYAEARATAEQAVALGVETTPTRRLLYQLGIGLGDGSAAQHLEWARNRPREFDLVSAQAQAAAFHGRLREAVELYERAADMAVARGLRGTASGYVAHLAWTEALFADSHQVRERVTRIMGRMGTDADSSGTVPRFRAGAAFALAGLTNEAQTLLSSAQQRYPDSTFVRTVLTPATRAGIALRQSRPDDAIEALRGAVPTEAGTFAGLVPFYLRGEAYLQKGSAADAIREYEKILAHRGVDPLAPIVPLAHLGLARARARAGDVDGSRRAYEDLFAIWSGADSDFVPLAAARTEHARLAPSPARPRN
jgi:eukaryotic-like serine/threonine-protein kinase